MNVWASFAGFGCIDGLSVARALQMRPPCLWSPWERRGCVYAWKGTGWASAELLGAQPVHLYLPLTSGGLSQLLCHQGRGAATGNKYFKQTAVKVIQRMISFHSIVIGLPVRSVTRCLSIISETLNRKHWLANGQSCFRSDRGSVKGLPRGVCSCSYCVFLTGWDCRRWIKEERSEPWYRGPFYSCPLGSEGAGGILFSFFSFNSKDYGSHYWCYWYWICNSRWMLTS